ncbi:MAG TPA: VanZ family protein [Longimicrobiales bacterium]|nr:VanZ family protein [Longimicrobiales bacterium]
MRRLLPWLPALVWALGVWHVGGLPSVRGVPSVPGLDKVGHFGMYGVLGFLLAFGWVRSTAGSRTVAALLLALALGMGAADEVRQGMMESRSQDVMDWVADALGAAAGFAFGAWFFRRRMDR